MIWIDGEYFEPLLFGSLQEQQMILAQDLIRMREVLTREFGVYSVLDAIVKLMEAVR